MASLGWTNDDTLQSIRVRSALPDADANFGDATLLGLLNEEVQAWLTPIVLEMRSEYLVGYQDVALVSGQQAYPIPSGAVAGRLRLLQFVDPNGRPQVRQLQQVDVRDAGDWWGAPGPWGRFFIQDNSIMLLGGIPGGWGLRVTYEKRLPTGVLAAACAQITAINTTSKVVGVTAFPATMTTGTSVDFIQGTSPFVVRGTATMATPSGVTVACSALPAGLVVGDWLALTGESPFMGLPSECVVVLRQWLATKVLELKADDAISVTEAKLKALEGRMRSVLAPRVLGNKKALGSMLGQPTGPWFWPYWS